MRRAILFILALATAAGLALSTPQEAFAGDDRYDGYQRDYRYGGYWERPSDRRRWNRYRHRPYYDDGVSYYPGYGYYADDGSDRRDRRYDRRYDRRDRDSSRSEWCARRYRSYDWRSGTFVGYDGVRRYCG